ncbi:WD40 repeat domain-containing protein [Candidatus Eisenbacteria bacterium]|uniref:WD40 repeat domain-containing protein n=1 Tax=Eiseniibacteriota bacterium TaxID=2212470 RepID=A0ABV6YMY2_UNCEI
MRTLLIIAAGIIAVSAPAVEALEPADVSMTLREQVAGFDENIRAIAISPDKTMLALGYPERNIRIWHVGEWWGPFFNQYAPDSYIEDLAFSPDGTLLACASGDDVSIWSVSEATLLDRFKVYSAFCVEFSPDGTWLAAGGYDMCVWNVAERRVTMRRENTGTKVVAFSGDGSFLATGSIRGRLSVYALEQTPKLVCSTQAYTDGFYALALSPEGDIIVSVGRRQSHSYTDKWDAMDLSRLSSFVNMSWTQDLKFLNSGSVLLSFSASCVGLFATENDRQLMKMKTGCSGEAAISQDGRLLVTECSEGEIALWDLQIQKSAAPLGSVGVADLPCDTVYRCPDWVFSVAVSPDGSRIAAGCRDSTVRMWRIAEQGHGPRERRVGYMVELVEFSLDGSQFGSSGFSEFDLWLTDGWKELTSEAIRKESFSTVRLDPTGSVVASAIWHGGGAKIWDTSDLSHVATVDRSGKGIEALAFSPNGKLFAMSYSDGNIRVWQRAGEADPPSSSIGGVRRFFERLFKSSDWVNTITLRCPGEEADALAFNPDGVFLAAACEDSSVIVWNLNDQVIAANLSGFGCDVFDLAFSPNGQWLACAGWEGRVYSVLDWEQVAEITGHQNRVYSLSFFPDSDRIATCGRDATVRIWSLEPIHSP